MTSLSTTVVFLAAALGADEVQQKPGGRIVPPVQQPAFQLTVQEKRAFPNSEPAPASSPTGERGLSVSIQPEKRQFALNEPLAFLVTFENESKKPFLLPAADRLGGKPQLVVANMQTSAQWTVTGEFKDAAKPVKLEPGKSVTYTLLVSGIIAQPRPLPVQPVAKPARAIQPGDDIRVALGPAGPFVAGPALPCGAGKCRAFLKLQFAKPAKAQESELPTWIGRIASKPADFVVGGVQAIQPPVVPLPRLIPRPVPQR